ncbi:condensation domain-containing protein [Rhodococcus sp. G-MC3]|uniref:condensation domain-containing protein n=1 Tax=Rhodococcus sp. G-MC3 TaxID=3046209 RepID=UPI0024BB92F4|nr:condensation domain-containing protein [Rhodococcus sp. G-MC3]MDJ0395141.1 condensation domain-containing protein [Rhodococcus sp. G-MC3]
MRVTSITEYLTDPGTYIEWPVSLGEGTPSPVPPSFNQNFHLSAALSNSDQSSSTVWIAGAFDVVGTLDEDSLAWAIEQFISRHDALRTTFRSVDGEIFRQVHGAHKVHVGRPSQTRITDPYTLSAHVRTRFDVLCHPSRHPSYSFAAVERPDRSTILCGFDHAHVDAVSIVVAVEELSALYDARRSGTTIELDATGSFIEYCAAEAASPVVPVSDPRVEKWAEFVEHCGGSTPGFPFDLGVPHGVQAPQATTIHALADAEHAAAFESECRRLGTGMFAGIAAAMAEASARIGGPTRLPLLFPLHTRRDKQYEHAVGWFTTNAPMSVTVGQSFGDTLASAYESFRAALPLGTVPIPRVLQALGERFTRTREDVFMISYIDYRTLLRGEGTHLRAHHISNATTADDAQFWITRTGDGLSLRARFPDTEQAHAVIDRFVEQLTQVVRSNTGESPSPDELSLVGHSA